MCAYSSLMVKFLNDSWSFILILQLKYFKIKYGFHPILADWQLEKIRLIFKIERLKIQATEIVLPSYLRINWESVGVWFVLCCIFAILTIDNSVEGIEDEHPGRKSIKIPQPDPLFLNNISDYQFNRFLHVGRDIINMVFVQWDLIVIGIIGWYWEG